MSKWLLNCDGKNVCDVACGTGKLILTYLDLLGYEESRRLISSGLLYLYDFDSVALKICKTAISIKYGLDISNKIHDIYGDFLSPTIKLPNDSKVISNPPYAKIESMGLDWEQTEVLKDSKEFYSAFMDKIFRQSKSTVIITPFSFLSGSKFYSLRKEMCNLGSGFVVAFDNVPGNIFCGRKHGIFNTNTANSVRAAITVFTKTNNRKGFRITPLIRFKNEQRSELLVNEVLEKMIPEETQVVDRSMPMFRKVFRDLTDLYESWVLSSEKTLKDLVSKTKTAMLVDMPNTCRYYTTGSSKKLSRGGSITLFFDNEEFFDYAYCFINSSFTYWWWRVFDGGITYPVSLLMNMPIPIQRLTSDDKLFFHKMRVEMSEKESQFVITKANAGAVQENIKFPDEYRNKINERIIKILGRNDDVSLFNLVHSNKF